VKEGYVPADERPRYQCKAQADAGQRESKFPIGYSPKELQKQANGIKEQRKLQAAQPPANSEPKSTPITPQDHVQKKIHGLRKKLDDIDKLKVSGMCLFVMKFDIYRRKSTVENWQIRKKTNSKSWNENRNYWMRSIS
jgi:hypothetical protein